MADEQLKVTEAWEYFRNKTGVLIERRAFFSWIEDGYVTINEQIIDLTANQINKTWYIARHQVDRLITTLIAPNNCQRCPYQPSCPHVSKALNLAPRESNLEI